MPRIYYCPLEAYKERYTMQLSAPITGWLERSWIAADIDYTRIEGDRPHEPVNIVDGVALDAVGRSTMCFAQVTKLLDLLPKMNDDDVIYFDDFWHPGIEAIAYAAQVMKRPIPKMYANLWAQSVDVHDFTYPMRSWMRHFEKGFGELLAGIFVACPSLRKLVIDGGIANPDKVHAVGHPFSSEEVKARMPEYPESRADTVVFSSRWDTEKNPMFFLSVVDAVLKQRPQTEFVICSSHAKLRSNDPGLLANLEGAIHKHDGRLILREGLSKEEYYAELANAKVQMNTAFQDWISFTMLEASCAGTYPLYPNYRSFPEVLRFNYDYMYTHCHVKHAASRVCKILDRDDLWTKEAIADRAWIHERFDTTWHRMAVIMGIMGNLEGQADDPFKI